MADINYQMEELIKKISLKNDEIIEMQGKFDDYDLTIAMKDKQIQGLKKEIEAFELKEQGARGEEGEQMAQEA